MLKTVVVVHVLETSAHQFGMLNVMLDVFVGILEMCFKDGQ